MLDDKKIEKALLEIEKMHPLVEEDFQKAFPQVGVFCACFSKFFKLISSLYILCRKP